MAQVASLLARSQRTGFKTGGRGSRQLTSLHLSCSLKMTDDFSKPDKTTALPLTLDSCPEVKDVSFILESTQSSIYSSTLGVALGSAAYLYSVALSTCGLSSFGSPALCVLWGGGGGDSS